MIRLRRRNCAIIRAFRIAILLSTSILCGIMLINSPSYVTPEPLMENIEGKAFETEPEISYEELKGPTENEKPISLNHKTIDTKLRIVGKRFAGQLGNHLFQYASLLGIAAYLNRTPCYEGSSLLALTFQNCDIQRCASWIQKHGQHFGERKPGAYDHDIVKLNEIPASTPVVLDGYFQSWKYFESVEEKLRQTLQFRRGIKMAALKTFDAAVGQILKRIKDRVDRSNVTVIGMHVRGGDYFSRKSTDFGYKAAPVAYFRVATEYFRRNFTNPIFLIATNDKRWVRQNLNLTYDMAMLRASPGPVDLAIMALCNHVIMSVGTFSWWAAWLAGGHATYYSDFIPPKTHYAKLYENPPTEYIYPGWVGLTGDENL